MSSCGGRTAICGCAGWQWAKHLRRRVPVPHSLRKKFRLSSSILAVAKVAQPNADEAKTLPRLQANTLPQRQRDAGQLLARGKRSAWRVAPSENLEITRLQFEHHGASDS